MLCLDQFPQHERKPSDDECRRDGDGCNGDDGNDDECGGDNGDDDDEDYDGDDAADDDGVVVVGSRCVCRRAGGAIPLLACAETRVLALTSPVIELWFCFRISCRAALCKNVLTSTLRIVVFGVFLCGCVCVYNSASVSTVFLPTLDFLHMPALDLHFSFSSVWGVEG